METSIADKYIKRLQREEQKRKMKMRKMEDSFRKTGMQIEPMFPEVDPRPWPYPKK